MKDHENGSDIGRGENGHPALPQKAACKPENALDTTTHNGLCSNNSSLCELIDEKELERLGRMRPECFQSLWSEIGFVASICMAQILTEYYVSGFNVLVPSVVSVLDIPAASSTWPASAFSLVVSCFLLPMGRLSDMYGGKRLFIIGVGWLVIWSIVGGVAETELTLDFARALQGLGPAAFLPSSVMLLGTVYRPGPRKNLVFSIYGACAPLGFFLGIFCAGLAAQLASWRVYFYIGAILSAISFFVAWASMPSDADQRGAYNIKMDWPGTILIVSGLILLVFALTASSQAPKGWRNPYIPVTFCAGVIILVLAGWWEGWKAEQPLVPRDIFNVPMFPAVVGAMFMQYGGLGIFLLHSTYYMEGVLGGSPLQVVVWFTPMCVGGIIIATIGGFVLHLLSGTVLMLIAGVAWAIAPLLFAIMPENQTYWAYLFPAMILGTVGIDISFNISNIFLTTGLPKRQQGLAGAIINSNMHLSIAFFLGLSEIITNGTSHQGLRQSYKYVFWFEVGLASIALLIMLVFVRLDRAKSDMTADEKEQFKLREAELGAARGPRGERRV